jgi:hypothetical protein
VGVSNLKALLSFVISLVVAITESLEDGKLSLSDLFKFFNALKKAIPAFRGISQIRSEIQDLSDAEKTELSAQLAEELELKNETVEQYIEEALKMAIALLDLLPLGKK